MLQSPEILEMYQNSVWHQPQMYSGTKVENEKCEEKRWEWIVCIWKNIKKQCKSPLLFQI